MATTGQEMRRGEERTTAKVGGHGTRPKAGNYPPVVRHAQGADRTVMQRYVHHDEEFPATPPRKGSIILDLEIAISRGINRRITFQDSCGGAVPPSRDL